jgi:fructosamine-3-kinase
MRVWSDITASIEAVQGKPFRIAAREAVGGGCINETYRIEGGGQVYFVKFHRGAHLNMFEAEAAGLKELSSGCAIRVPLPICWGRSETHSYLVMEYIEFGGRGDAAQLGGQLAKLHRVCSRNYGWVMDNTIGATPQVNAHAQDWVTFWREHRLDFQLQLALRNGYGGELQSKGQRLSEVFPALFADYSPRASLLHGDLWAGNHAVDIEGNPVIYDPAVYYGDREADLAMTELFGGFGNSFYRAYNEHYPLDEGYRARKNLYNLYHILNHLNLFGGGYEVQAVQMMESILAELGA